MEYYVYVFLREDRYTPYYVGKGKGNRCYNKRKYTKLPRDRDRIVKVKEGLTDEQSQEIEKTLIKFWGRLDNGTGVLRNYTDGGDGTSGYRHTEETKRVMSEKLKGRVVPEKERENMRRGRIGMKLSEEHKQNISKRLKGKPKPPRSEEHRINMGKSRRGKKLSEETKRKISEGMKKYRRGG